MTPTVGGRWSEGLRLKDRETQCDEMTTGWIWQLSRDVIPTEDPKGPIGGIYGDGSQRAPP